MSARRFRLHLGALLGLFLAFPGCVTPPSPPPTPPEPADAAPRAALQAFLAAEQGQDFRQAYALLAAPLRARYTPERLQADYLRDHDLATDKLSRIRAALQAGTPLRLEGERALLPVGRDRAAVLIKEPEGWRVAALE